MPNAKQGNKGMLVEKNNNLTLYQHVNTSYAFQAQEPTAGRRELHGRPHSNKDVPEIELTRLDKPNIVGSEVLDKRLVMCFTDFANENWHALTRHFMRKTVQVYEDHLDNKRKDSLRNLTSFLHYCETGKWTPAKSLYSVALKEYEHYWNTKAQEPTAGSRELSDGPHSNKEVHETQLIRRSKDASILLKENNSNITDLSDPNRPIYLAERFSELYINEYTDALDELNGTNSNPAESIKCLLDIVKASYLFCTKQRKQMLDDQMNPAGSSTDDLGKRYEMMKLGKTAETALPNVREEFMKPRQKAMGERTQRFAEQCVEIVWLMCIQQPPVHLEYGDKRETFNPDHYRGYTKSGKFIEFCVWPVVYFHENGPILTKGIAQGYN
ncbi:hypothetical protein ACJMK2_031138 [Sinanodonta woodiana]|uniref:Mitochondria-eating protein C-terminal domain-containing protein n=1 Tax=Sinanodonta woodiana TaxID=1069815 RepID=A0ABD3WXV9_SINWO